MRQNASGEAAPPGKRQPTASTAIGDMDGGPAGGGGVSRRASRSRASRERLAMRSFRSLIRASPEVSPSASSRQQPYFLGQPLELVEQSPQLGVVFHRPIVGDGGPGMRGDVAVAIGIQREAHPLPASSAAR